MRRRIAATFALAGGIVLASGAPALADTATETDVVNLMPVIGSGTHPVVEEGGSELASWGVGNG